MGCDFKVGDDITRIDDDPWVIVGSTEAHPNPPVFGEVYTAAAVSFDLGEAWVCVEGFPGDDFLASRFRKVERKTDKRSLTEWLAQPTEVEEPKRAPAKKRERVE